MLFLLLEMKIKILLVLLYNTVLKKPMAPTRPNHVCKTFVTPHIGHSRHGLFFTRWIVNPTLNLLKRTMTYPVFEPWTFGLAVSIANHYTI
jgi:hypothetical protein